MDKSQSGPPGQDLPGFDEIVTRMLASLPVQKRLQGIPVEERLHGIAIERRLTGIKGFESLLALPDDVIASFSYDYLRSLPEDVRTQLVQRLGRTPH